jgi:hypothetical protein
MAHEGPCEYEYVAGSPATQEYYWCKKCWALPGAYGIKPSATPLIGIEAKRSQPTKKELLLVLDRIRRCW